MKDVIYLVVNANQVVRMTKTPLVYRRAIHRLKRQER